MMSEEQLHAYFPHAMGPATRFRNRYSDILPTCVEIVTLKQPTNYDTTYINANRYRNMIITQGPLKTPFVDTVADFWVMAFEQGRNIACLTDHMDGVTEKTYPYWMPHDLESAAPLVYRSTEGAVIDLEVSLVEGPSTAAAPNEQGEMITKRVFRIALNGTVKYINHWYFENWKDLDTCDPEQLAQLIQLVSFPTAMDQNDATIVHCSAGIGRSGVFAVAKYFIDCYLPNGSVPIDEDIDNAVNDLRQRRPGAVQSLKQLDLIRKTIQAYARANRASLQHES